MSTFVAIHTDGVIAITCRESIDAFGQIEFYDIDEHLYEINLHTGKIWKNIKPVNSEEREMLVLEKHPKFTNGSIDIIPNRTELQQSLIFFIFEWTDK